MRTSPPMAALMRWLRRLADVLNSHSVDIYRQLAGGVTVSHILHGSANPIGGQCAAIKLRWGVAPQELLLEAAKPTIKFALGENVKQSNWGDKFTSRYPQTRMRVEQLIRDRLAAAQDYERRWRDYDQRGKKKGRMPPRRDLELEALAEVLHGQRLVHCHSYRQDEILMLVRVAEDFGFTVGTFQHVLEGYKVAEVLKAHGAAASTFSDWWAYKFEVYDAIPFNAALMQQLGVGVSINSDLQEWGRRLNTEAAKAVKYGGASPEQALRMVTINPARQIGAEAMVGSLEPGKDADFALWNGPPLSAYSRCEQTWVDGRLYFDREADLALRQKVQRQRARIVQRILSEDGDKNGK
jgi:imidazolonepropionase-like amidohydrolase